jgi:hypothetical protein
MKQLLTIPLLLLCALNLSAQQGLSVDSIFNDYGKQHGSVLLNLGKDVLGGNSNIERYKCLIIKDKKEAATKIRQAVKDDYDRRSVYRNGIIFKEITENGTLRNASYCLGARPPVRTREYLLFSVANDKITLIYLTGRFRPGDLNKELSKLKDLFIKVNNKEIKLY